MAKESQGHGIFRLVRGLTNQRPHHQPSQCLAKGVHRFDSSIRRLLCFATYHRDGSLDDRDLLEHRAGKTFGLDP